ncbi:MAG TPA: glycine cleavage system protein H [Anaerolineae bacterium]|nr:glycine cleavage system protein H [Anaerolineae bacterium]
MPEFLETTVDKFTFKVALDRRYTSEGVWVLAEGDRVRIGLSDFVQQRSGDVAFAEVKPIGAQLAIGDEVAVIETIKVNVSLGAPVAGTIVAINPQLETAPEIINQDPYGAGWLARLEPGDWEADRAHLLEPQAYFDLMRGQAEAEAKSA